MSSDGSGLEDVSRPCPAKEFTRVNLAAAKSGRTHRLNLSALHHNRRANMLKQFEICCCQEKFDETGPESRVHFSRTPIRPVRSTSRFPCHAQTLPNFPNCFCFPWILGVTSSEGLEDRKNLEKLRHPSSRPGGSWEQVVERNLAGFLVHGGASCFLTGRTR